MHVSGGTRVRTALTFRASLGLLKSCVLHQLERETHIVHLQQANTNT